MADLPSLDALDQRLLGALMEKQVTVPASYPLSLNALRTACNQSSSRDPVTDHDEAVVEEGARSLKDRGLVRIVWADRGRRTLKYHQRLTEELDLDEREAALLTVLLLRGAQAPGELRTRTERLHAFDDRTEVEKVLALMAERGLVRELPRQPGQKDQRWVHLLGPAAEAVVEQPEAVDVLADGQAARDERVRRAYDEIAPAYAAQVLHESADVPFERWLLDQIAEQAGGYPIADVGCGPGQVTNYLHQQGALVRGYDVSSAMIEQAQQQFPEIAFEVADLRRLLRPVDADGWGAVLAWHSLLHLAPRELADAIGALARVLRPTGALVLAVPTGQPEHLVSLWRDQPGGGVDVVPHERGAVLHAIQAAGLIEVEWFLCGSAAATETLYLRARKP